MPRTRTAVALVASVFVALVLGMPAASAHEEREVDFPDGSGSVPEFRVGDPDLVVCKPGKAAFEERIEDFPESLRKRNLELFELCQQDGFEHVQAAVDAVDEPGMNIAILPGVYLEEPTQPEPSGECADLDAPESDFGYQVLSFEQQSQCPANQNLVAILGKENLQIEGTGEDRGDVIIDGQYKKLNVIRADMSDGVYFHNFTAQRSTFNSLYVLASDGFVIDDVLTRWNDEYGFLTFASDHGLYTNCESYGNGDSGIYPGSASNINDGRGYDVPRYAIEITECRSHHNMVGYSGTAGDSVYVHDSEFDHNMGGVAMDSAFPGHPGLPQNHANVERNLIHDNNEDYYRYIADGTCAKPPAERGYEDGVVCPQISMPPGSGIITAGGNWNLFQNNWVYGHDRTAFYLSAVPAFIRGEEDLSKQFDTSHHNRYADNQLGVDREGKDHPNRISVWWDGQGGGNCWQSDADQSNPHVVPACGDEPGEVSRSSDRVIGEPVKLAQLMVCAEYRAQEARLPAGCDWYGATGIERVEVQIALGIAIVLALVGGVLWWRLLRRDGVATFATMIGAVGLALSVVGAMTTYAHTLMPPLGLLMLGIAWTVIGIRLLGARRVFAWVTIALGLLTLADAFDKTVMMIPWTPMSPAWLRGILGLIWVVWAVVAAARRPKGGTEESGSDSDVTDPVPA